MDMTLWKMRCNVLLLLTSCHTDASDSSSQICMKVKKQQLELDMEQQTGSKLRKEYIKAVYCHPAYLTSKERTDITRNARLDEAQAGIKTARRKINNQICRGRHPYGRK